MKYGAVLLAVSLPVSIARAQGAESSFPLEPLHASAVGLGAAGVAVRGAPFFSLNPAATAQVRGVELSHWTSPTGARDVAFALGHGSAWGTVRLAVRRRTWGSIAGDLGLTDLTVGEQSIVMGFARRELHERLNWGLSFGRLDADYLGTRQHAWSVDLGAQANAGHGFLIGLSILHLGTDFQTDGTAIPLPTRIRPGIAWERQTRQLRVLAAADVPFAIASDVPSDFHAGAEVGGTWGTLNAMIRGGYQSLADRDGGASRQGKWSVGGGLRVLQIRADVAYVLGGVFGPERFLSLSLHW